MIQGDSILRSNTTGTVSKGKMLPVRKYVEKRFVFEPPLKDYLKMFCKKKK